MVLLRCPRCGALYENSPGGADVTRRLTESDAERLFPAFERRHRTCAARASALGQQHLAAMRNRHHPCRPDPPRRVLPQIRGERPGRIGRSLRVGHRATGSCRRTQAGPQWRHANDIGGPHPDSKEENRTRRSNRPSRPRVACPLDARPAPSGTIPAGADPCGGRHQDQRPRNGCRPIRPTMSRSRSFAAPIEGPEIGHRSDSSGARSHRSPSVATPANCYYHEGRSGRRPSTQRGTAELIWRRVCAVFLSSRQSGRLFHANAERGVGAGWWVFGASSEAASLPGSAGVHAGGRRPRAGTLRPAEARAGERGRCSARWS
jgi:hypothetical protein